jgi:hypothetical protein
LPPVYTGPTPANPFGGNTFDIFDVLERTEAETPAQMAAPVVLEPEPADVGPGSEPVQAEGDPTGGCGYAHRAGTGDWCRTGGNAVGSRVGGE